MSRWISTDEDVDLTTNGEGKKKQHYDQLERFTFDRLIMAAGSVRNLFHSQLL